MFNEQMLCKDRGSIYSKVRVSGNEVIDLDIKNSGRNKKTWDDLEKAYEEEAVPNFPPSIDHKEGLQGNIDLRSSGTKFLTTSNK